VPIDLLEATLQESADEELSIILEDARRRLQEFNQRVQEAVAPHNVCCDRIVLARP